MSGERSIKRLVQRRWYPLLTVLVFVGYAILWALLTGLLDQFRLGYHGPHGGGIVVSPVSGDKLTRFVVWLPVDGAEM